jgi:hypothetical protein
MGREKKTLKEQEKKKRKNNRKMKMVREIIRREGNIKSLRQ